MRPLDHRSRDPSAKRRSAEPIEGRAAPLLLHCHGDDAEPHAARRADELVEAGDDAGCRVWKRSLAALDELRRTRPRAGEARH